MNRRRRLPSLAILRAASSGESGERSYWQIRQDALGIDSHGETLEPDEIVFYERLGKIYGEPLADIVDIIPRDKMMKPTNDFLWLIRDGVPVEIKSPTVSDYGHAERRIWNATIKAAEQGIIKDVFIVNYGDLPLSADAIELLASYNENHATGKIRELWVLVGERLTKLI